MLEHALLPARPPLLHFHTAISCYGHYQIPHPGKRQVVGRGAEGESKGGVRDAEDVYTPPPTPPTPPLFLSLSLSAWGTK